MTENSQRDEGAKEAHHDEAEKHPPLAWTALSPGQAVGLRIYDTEHYVGTVESKTVDGASTWTTDDLRPGKDSRLDLNAPSCRAKPGPRNQHGASKASQTAGSQCLTLPSLNSLVADAGWRPRA